MYLIELKTKHSLDCAWTVHGRPDTKHNKTSSLLETKTSPSTAQFAWEQCFWSEKYVSMLVLTTHLHSLQAMGPLVNSSQEKDFK